MKLWLIIITIAFATECVVGLMHRCPQRRHFHPDRMKQKPSFFDFCSCNKNTSVYVTCEGFENKEDLYVALSFLRGYFVDHLIIKNSGYLHLTEGTFKRVSIQKLTFEDTRFDTLILFSALKGLEFELEELQFVKCRINNLVWQKGKGFTVLKTLSFDKTNLNSEMSNNVFKTFPSKLRNLKMTYNNIRELGNEAFKRLSHLERIELGGNHLTRISRSMFPRPARRLRHLSLTGNPITELPHDMFVDMDRLEFLLLADTQLTSLKNETFFPVWNQLEEIYLNNIKLNCDCNVVWMLKKTEIVIFKKPFCTSHNKILDDIKNLEEICTRRKLRLN